MSELVDRFLARSGDVHPAVIDAAGTHAYADVVLGARRTATAILRVAGPLAGRRVAMLVPPGAAFVTTFFGILLAGGTVVVLSPLHPPAESRYFCEDGEVAAVLVAAAHADLAAPLAEAFRVVPLETLVGGDLAIDAASLPEDAPALQLYTSGTTGKPKGAVITHGNLAVQQRLVGEAWRFSPKDVLLHTLPLHHMHGLAIALLTALGAGATTRFMPFDAPRVWASMPEATVFMGVPSMYHRLFVAYDAEVPPVRESWARGSARLRLATSGSAALPVTLAQRWREATGTIPLERFGMTEIGVGLTNPLDGERVPGAVGHPLPTVETRIVDGGADAETGELLVRGPSVFAGYHGKPEETAKAFVAADDGGQPWFRTGDTVTRDMAMTGGPFRILGRTSVDILKSGGYKLSALEIEERLRAHDDVSEAAVVGIPDEAWGDRVVACIVVRAGRSAPSPEALRAFVRAELAPYKVPKDVVVLDDLPKNALGKVVKPRLVELLRGSSVKSS